MNMKTAMAMALLAALVCVSACGGGQRPISKTSLRMAVNSQKVNPTPPPAYPVTGLDGQRALDVYGKYIDPSKAAESKKREQPVYLIDTMQ